jgi:hypothetical protein
MKLSYFALRLYFFGLGGLAGVAVSKILTENTEAPWYIDGFFRTLPLLTICFLSDFLLKRNCRTLFITEEADTGIDALELNRAYFVDPVPEKNITYYKVTQVGRVYQGEVEYRGGPQTIIVEGETYPEKGLAVLERDREGKKIFRNVRIRTHQ